MWQPDKRSSEAEDFVCEAIRRHVDGAQVVRSRHAAFDMELTLPHGTKRTYEIKADFMAQRTGNVYFEIANTYKHAPSGLRATRADVWAHYVPHLALVLLFDPQALLWYLTLHEHDMPQWVTKTQPNRGDKNSMGYLIPLQKLCSVKWAQHIHISSQATDLAPDVAERCET